MMRVRNVITISSIVLSVITLGKCSIKKGVGMGPEDLLCGDFAALNNITWWYDWRMNFWYYHTHTNCTNIDRHKFNHIPMVWGLDPAHPVAVPSNTPAILGYNEPNFKSQANMTAQQAADHWPEIERHSHGRPLVSPAAAPCSSQSKCYGISFEWFDEFFRLCKGCRVDYLATHAYYCNADTTMDYLQKLYRRYGKKIWLTEFSCPHTMDYGHKLNYMKAILPKLEAADFVDRYDWSMDIDHYKSNPECAPYASILDKFVPMVWSWYPCCSGNVTVPNKAEAVLGFNEPNHKEQANLKATNAALYWQNIERQSKGKPLVSPASAPCGGNGCLGNTNQWFDEFFRHCNGCRVDYLATHHYSCNADWTMSYLRDLYHRYGKKIWLTEFACSYSGDPHKIMHYMRTLLPKLEAAPFVYRYSWYMARIDKGDNFIHKEVSLLDATTSTLTDLGRYYNNFHSKDVDAIVG